MRRQRVLFVVNEASFFVSHRLGLALKAIELGYDIHVLTGGNSEAQNLMREMGITVHGFELSRSGTGPMREWRSLKAIWRNVKELKPDVLHLVTIKPVLYGGIVSRFLRVPRVVSAITGLGYVFIAQSRKGVLLRFFVTRLYRFALKQRDGKVIFQNPDDRELFIKQGMVVEKDAVLIKGSGVDTNVFRPLTKPDPLHQTVVLAARMLWDKGVGEFVEAVRELRSQGLNHRFVLVGSLDPSNPAAIAESDLAAWVEEGLVEWWGHRTDMVDILGAANVVCLPSYREGLPRVLIEAASCGCALVATDVPGCREIVAHEENGLLVPVRDHSSLAEALKTVIENKPLRERMGRRGRGRVLEEFSLDQVVRDTLALYEA